MSNNQRQGEWLKSMAGDVNARLVEAAGEACGVNEQRIREDRGYSADWPAISTTSAEAFLASQQQRQALLRDLTARGEDLEKNGALAGALLDLPARDAGAARYRQVVVTQR